MKSKSFDLKKSAGDKGKANKTFAFISLYKPAAETNNLVSEKQKAVNGIGKENSFTAKSHETPKRDNLPDKYRKKNKQEPLDISCINIEGANLDSSLHRNSPLNQSKVTSTPRAPVNSGSQVKSIMKTSSLVSDSTSNDSKLRGKPKKRNKSVSFMLDDTEEIVTKKTKSDESLTLDKKEKHITVKKSPVKDANIIKKIKKVKKPEVEKGTPAGDSMDTDSAQSSTQNKGLSLPGTSKATSDIKNLKNLEKKKKIKKVIKRKSEEKMETAETDNNNEDQVENKNKKLKKKKKPSKPSQSTDNNETEEPASKFSKKEIKAEVIAENLENLSIGDNPHTLTTLLDEMTVADKDKRKKIKRKHKKDKDTKSLTKSSSSTENSVDKTEGVKEKIKWKKRRWNKDKKGDVDSDTVITSVVVENLPLSMMCSYKKVLAEHFEKCGLIKRIGVAEINLGENSNVFTTTINFYSEGAATQALEEDGAELEGSRIQVKRSLPPTQTTVVVRSYAALSDQSLCTTFGAAGHIRNIRHLIKGKKSIETVFIEFDGPEAVKKVLEISKGAKVGGKKLHVEKYQLRKKPKRKAAESENDEGSDDSNE